MSRKAPTPIRTTPSSAPLEAMVAKQQSHIDELVMKNRSLEQTISKLRADLSGEKGRWDGTIQQLKQQSKVEQAEWKEGCDTLQSLWRIEHLRVIVDVEKEKTNVTKLREDLRMAKLARLRRDFQITMFQARESELEDRIQQLNYELELKGREKEAEAQFADSLADKVREAEEQLELSAEEKKQLENTLVSLRAEHTKILSSSTTDSTALERSRLQVEGLKSTLSDLQKKFDDSRSTNADLLRQLEKWRTIENRDGEELDSLRSRKAELEVKVKEYEGRVAEAAQIEKERDKLQIKIQKYKVSLEEHQTALDDANKDLDEREALVDELRAQIVELNTKVKNMAASLQASQLHSPPKASGSKSLFVDEGADRNASRSPTPPRRAPKPKPKPVAKKKSAPADDSDVQVLDDPPPNEQSKSAFDFGHADDDDVEEVALPKKGKERMKAAQPSSPAPAKRPRGRPKKVQRTPSAEPEEGGAKPVAAGNGRRGKRKGNDMSDASTDHPPPKRAKKAPVVRESDSEAAPPKKKDSTKPVPKPKPKPKARDSSPAPAADASGSSIVPKKKKRKINLFAPSDVPLSFDFGLKTTSQNGSGGLDIPLELSPVKEGDPSLLGRALSGLGGRR